MFTLQAISFNLFFTPIWFNLKHWIYACDFPRQTVIKYMWWALNWLLSYSVVSVLPIERQYDLPRCRWWLMTTAQRVHVYRQKATWNMIWPFSFKSHSPVQVTQIRLIKFEFLCPHPWKKIRCVCHIQGKTLDFSHLSLVMWTSPQDGVVWRKNVAQWYNLFRLIYNIFNSSSCIFEYHFKK